MGAYGAFQVGRIRFPLASGNPRIVNVVTVTFSGSGGTQQSPYTCLPFDAVKIDESDGNLVVVKFEPQPVIGGYHTVVWALWVPTSPPPIIDFNGKLGTPFSQNVQASGALVTTTAINLQGAAQSWMFDGTQWVNAT